MPEDVSIVYELGQGGWSKFLLTVGASSVVVGRVGYCTDALGDLVRAALMIATSGWQAKVSFDGEPTERRLVVGPYWESASSEWTDFRVRVLVFPWTTSPPTPDSEGEKIFEASCSPDAFVQAVLRAAQAVWDEHGVDGYDSLWGGPCGFPVRALNALQLAVTIQEPRTTWL